MRTSSLGIAMIALCLCAPCGQAMAQYAASDASMNTDIQNAGRRSLSQHALESHRQAGSATAQGPNVNLQIEFPGDQTGLDNIEAVMLVPQGGGAHEAEAIAQHPSEQTLYAVFIASKGVAPSRSYDVVVSDARGDKYLVGEVHVGKSGRQDFTLRAPLLMPDSPLYQGPHAARDVPSRNADDVAQPSPERLPSREALKVRYQREAARQPWISGMKVLTITPLMLAVLGQTDADIQAVVVHDVAPYSPAAKAGIIVGDVIASINGHRCTTAEEFARFAFGDETNDAIDLEMYSMRLERAVNLRIVGDVRWDPSFPARERRHHGHRTVRWQMERGDISAGDSRYVPPTTGPGYVAPGESSYVPPATGPGYVPPGESRYAPPTVGPGFVPPANGPDAAIPNNPPEQAVSPKPPAQQSDVKPLPEGSSDFKAPTTGPGYTPPGG